MEMSEREHHIKVLENLLSHYKAREQCEGYYDSTLKDNVEALEYAISSIKTDEAYQIMYEGGEIFTKADIVDMLEELKKEVEKNGIVDFEETYVDDGECIISVSECNRLIQQKINALGGVEGEHDN